ncbi:dephospho-CoA kinase [Bifidobacterium sp. ESL0764]|uniref:dephospho-CoA kinase n=1 Tax=Bifidobacterium sp. ESL0764 TaxID=2983228 RepID=UPI0023F7B3DF|nr:dephospho-CoA kinase [Bifidobacterium sp. ESL0764]WEV65190.1 dephospho-CoA kinase [Bifidobacterium sp. ESL0764]
MRIGLTGGIAAGKSTVAAHLKGLGACLVDYDQLARQVVEPGSVGMRRIVREFGAEAMNPDGSLNRRWMAAHVFSPQAAPDARQRLDEIEHPLIYQRAQELERQIVEKYRIRTVERENSGQSSLSPVIVHDVPLLAEVIDTIPFSFDHILTVEAPEEVRIQRMMEARGMSREQAEGRIRHQSSRGQREAIADVVIDSTQPIEQMFERLDMLFAQWR